MIQLIKNDGGICVMSTSNENRNISIEDYGELISDGAKIVETADTFRTEIDSIYKTVGELKEAWSGSSAERYATNIEEFKDDLYKFQELIGGHGQLVNAVGKDYESLEERL